MADQVPQVMQVDLNLSEAGRSGRVSFAGLIGEFAPSSPIYTGNPPVKASCDAIVAAGIDLEAKGKDVDAKKKAWQTAVVAVQASEQNYDNCAGVLKANVQIYCKTPADVQSLGANRKARRAAGTPPVIPTDVTAKPGKLLGEIMTHATKIPGLTKYYLSISVDPITPTSWVVLNGTAARRTISGYQSGKGYWIRYCTERGSDRSDWSTPVYVLAK